jgi:hypothetical protein
MPREFDGFAHRDGWGPVETGRPETLGDFWGQGMVIETVFRKGDGDWDGMFEPFPAVMLRLQSTKRLTVT